VLKYRLAYTPGTDKEFAPNLLAPPVPRPTNGALPPSALPDEAQKYGIADGIQAIKVVRANAAKWGIDADKIVFVGFSAGGVAEQRWCASQLRWLHGDACDCRRGAWEGDARFSLIDTVDSLLSRMPCRTFSLWLLR
jgi:hypothetical protein